MPDVFEHITKFTLIYGISTAIWTLLQVIAHWRLFEKSGQKGWKSLVPILSQYTAYKTAWGGRAFWLMMLFTFAGSALILLSPFYPQYAMPFTVGVLVCAILTAVMNMVYFFKLSRAFGHGALFALGLIFLNPIFIIVLGLGKSQNVKRQAAVGENS